ncbi:sensor histidine kinase [Flavisolibacter nicotianae]|uniref:sensor histidine kinase n=1 Tax=Flavisolibacter nicotianae TaxID=2364882 RepID=UPI0013C4E817|nr:7TM diverse intracellular signaling domain-containing protein [Flavisolibacter nicotianae]
MRYLLIWLLGLTATLASAQEVVVVEKVDEIVNLAPSARYLEDKDGRLTVSDFIYGKQPGSFQRNGKEDISFGVTPSFFWLRSDIRNATDSDLLLELASTALTDIAAYSVVDNTIVKQYHAGNWQPFQQRVVKSVNYLFPLSIPTGKTATVYLRVMHYRGTQFPLRAGTLNAFYIKDAKMNLAMGIYIGFMLVMILYNLFIYFTLRDRSYLYYVAYTFMMAFFNAHLSGYVFRFAYPSWTAPNRYEDVIAALVAISGILFAANFLNTRKNVPFFHRLFMGLLGSYVVIIGIVLSGQLLLGTVVLEFTSLVLVGSFFVAAYQTLRKGYSPAKFFLIAWSLLLLSVAVYILKDYKILPYTALTASSLQIGSAVEALLLSLALADKINVYKKETMAAQAEALHSLEENRKLITEQNVLLEKRVEERTKEWKQANRELVTALRNLKETQAQLVQKEKMASLGELTAGIAHEIQNPLNFVNNFSEVSNELTEEIRGEVTSGQTEKAAGLLTELKGNLDKILFHGKRADSIVKGMLHHSHLGTGKREATDINALVEEHLHLAYHALRAKQKNLTVILETHFDESVGRLEVVPQDLGRVLVNLFNNAFYSVQEKKKRLQDTYQPVVSVYTRKKGDAVAIGVRDNGTGMSPNVKEKIYQPFFTTKPAGEGTGLGLSLSYDIVTKQHGGSLRVETKEGQFAEFTVELPVKKTV